MRKYISTMIVAAIIIFNCISGLTTYIGIKFLLGELFGDIVSLAFAFGLALFLTALALILNTAKKGEALFWQAIAGYVFFSIISVFFNFNCFISNNIARDYELNNLLNLKKLQEKLIAQSSEEIREYLKIDTLKLEVN